MLTQIKNFLPEDHLWQNQVIWYDVADSTNDQAKVLAYQGAPHGTVVLADRQTAGRGRLGRSFSSPAGKGIYMSVILRLQTPPDQLMHLTCAAAIAACNAIEKATDFRPGIKWTNDLVHSGKKLGGILTELIITPTETTAIIGIGINCSQVQADFPAEIQSFAGSLSMVCEKAIDRAQIAASLIEEFCEMAENLHNKQKILDTYRRDCITLGKQISIVNAEQIRHGVALDVDDQCALIVKFPDHHKESINAGEVSVRGMYGYCP